MNATTNNAKWYYEENGQRKGPINEEQIKAMITAQQLSYGDQVWKNGMKDWISLELSELNELLSETPPPLAGNKVNNTLVWLLAFAPIMGYVLEWIIALHFAKGNEEVAKVQMAEHSYWIVTLFLNLGLSYWDEKSLKKAGHDTTKFKGMTWLIPVYMYKRAKCLEHNMTYFAMWIISFLILLTA